MMQEENPYSLSLKNIFTTSWKIYSKILPIAALGFFTLMVVLSGLCLILFPIIFQISFSDFSNMLMSSPNEFQSFVSNPKFTINMGMLSLLFSCIIAPLAAGVLQSSKLAFENNPIPVKTVFSFYSSNYTMRIIGFTLVLKLIELGLSFLISSLGFSSFSMFFTMLLWLLTIFSIPMIIFENVSIGNAFNLSVKSVVPSMITIFLFSVLGGILAFSGMFVFGIGIIVTLPFWYALVFSMYYAVRGVKGNNLVF